MPFDPFDWIDAEARRRADAGLVRTLRPRPAASGFLDLASNDFLIRLPGVRHGSSPSLQRRPPKPVHIDRQPL
ncbi:hypothetical protein AB0Q93_37350, partial [Streptomyces sp. NPDC088184]